MSTEILIVPRTLMFAVPVDGGEFVVNGDAAVITPMAGVIARCMLEVNATPTGRPLIGARLHCAHTHTHVQVPIT